MKKCINILLAAVLIFTALIPGAAAYAAGQLCISRIMIESGDNAAEKLESSGYTVFYNNLNPSGKERIYLGYKLGNEPVTDLIVSSEQKKTISVNSVSYTLVSPVSLNQGTNGSPIYLYSTTDAKAGSGIVSLSCIKDNKDGSADLLDQFGDGSVPVRTADGRAADFDEGIGTRDLYLLTVHKNSCKPYISDMKIVNVSAGENAFEKIISSGCCFFNSVPVAESGKTCAYLCYNRTADSSGAVRSAVVSNNAEANYSDAGSFILKGRTVNLYYTKDAAAGNPVSEITKGALTGDSFTLGDWAKSYFSRADSGAMSQIYNEDLYKTLIESEEEYTQLKIRDNSAASDTGLYMILPAKGIKADKLEETAAELPSVQDTENAEMQRDTEITGIEKDEIPETTEAERTSENAKGSAIGSGSLIAVAVLAIIAVITALILVVKKYRKNR